MSYDVERYKYKEEVKEWKNDKSQNGWMKKEDLLK
jgi:hypothetical protein